MNIAQSIRSLLDKEGKVVIPGLGIFENKYHSARLQKDKKSISAPQTQTIFIQKLDAKDDALANYIAETEKVTVGESTKAIEDYVKSLTSKLRLAHRARIERLGYLVIRDKHLLFRPDVVNDLPELKAEPVKKAPAFVSYLAMPILLLFVMLLIIVYLLVNPFNTPLFQSKYSGHYPLSKYPVREIVVAEAKPAAQEEIKTPEPQPQQEKQEEQAVQPEEQVQQPVQEQEEYAGAQPSIPPPPRTGRYHIIVASLEYRTMAEVFAEKLIRNGYPEATVIGPAKNGNFRVSMDNFQDKSQALLHLMYARKLVDTNAWLLKY
jgi:nucleoid DNA-binding protein